jgi:nitrate/nitrite transport system permease protein
MLDAHASTLAAPAETPRARALRRTLATAAANLALPAMALATFLALWALLARSVETSLGRLPGPLAVAQAAADLAHQHAEERRKAAEHGLRQRRLAAEAAAAGKPFTIRRYAGPPTYLDQIATSLKTVFAGFVLASLVAVPLGLVCGSSPRVYAGLNPLIQIFKPVSPLAWLPIVMILVSALSTSPDPWFEKSFVSSAITVALCSLWPTLVNTALGVSTIDPEYVNVARALRLGWWERTLHIVLPAALPLIFTGLRLSLGVGWMVLIAAEMLAQNPGLGKFVWDMFQNGSSQSLALIMVAVFTVGLVGFALDRIMLALQRAVSFGS